MTGTGPGGRIVRRDLDRLPVAEPVSAPQPVRTPAPVVASSGPATGFTDVPLTGMRKAIARRLTESKTTVPHFYVTADCRVDDLLALRRTVNAAATTKVSLNDFVLKAVAGALIEVPDANAIWNGDSIRRFAGADIAVAVAVDGGLLTPVLRGVDTTPLSVLSARVADLAAAGPGRAGSSSRNSRAVASRYPTSGCSASPSSRPFSTRRSPAFSPSAAQPSDLSSSTAS